MASPASQAPSRPGEHERRVARGTLAQQGSQIVGVLAMLVAITLLARTLSLSEFGVYGLLLSFATYFLVIQTSVEGAAVRGIAGAIDSRQRNRVFSTALVLYAGAGLACGAIIAGVGVPLVGVLGIPRELRGAAREAVVALGLVTALGWPFKVFQDALRGSQRFVAASWAQILAQLVFVAGMAGLVELDAPLWQLIALGGSLPGLIGAASAVVLVATGAPFRFRLALLDRVTVRSMLGLSGYLSAIGVADLVIYALDRVILAAFRNTATVGLYEAAARPHSLVRQLNGTLVLTVLPVASDYLATGDEPRLHELLLRGTRYVMAVVVPVTAVLMVLSRPLVHTWLGERYDAAAPAVTLFLSYWLVTAGASVAGAALLAAGRVGYLTAYAWVGAIVNLALALLLTPWIGLEGVVLSTAIQAVAMYPWFLSIVTRHLPVGVRELARQAWLPAYVSAGVAAAALVALQLVVALNDLAAVALAAAGALTLAWALYYAVWLLPHERVLVHDFFRRSPS